MSYFDIPAGSAAPLTSFDDSIFRVYSSTDSTKLLAFNVGYVSPETLRTLIIPDADGTILLDSTLSISLSSPPPIGDITPNSGAFTTLTATDSPLDNIAPFNLNAHWDFGEGQGRALVIRGYLGGENVSTGSFLVEGYSGSAGDTPEFTITRQGVATFNGSVRTKGTGTFAAPATELGNGLALGSAAVISWSQIATYDAPDTYLKRVAPSSIGMENGLLAQNWYVYGTSSGGGANYRRFAMKSDSNAHWLQGETGGTETTRPIWIANGGAVRVMINPSGFIGFNTFSASNFFHIKTPTNLTEVYSMKLQGDASTQNRFIGIGFSVSTTDTAASKAGIRAVRQGTTADDISLAFHAGLDTERMRIGYDGIISFSGQTASFPALKRSSAELQVRLANDSAYTTIDAQLRSQGAAPATAGSSGTAGDIRYDSSNIYVCVAANTWKKVGIATF